VSQLTGVALICWLMQLQEFSDKMKVSMPAYRHALEDRVGPLVCLAPACDRSDVELMLTVVVCAAAARAALVCLPPLLLSQFKSVFGDNATQPTPAPAPAPMAGRASSPLGLSPDEQKQLESVQSALTWPAAAKSPPK
jgi:hypothetical protein